MYDFSLADCYMIAGSNLYGTALPNSDLDYRGFKLDSPKELLGFEKGKTFEYKTAGMDLVYYTFSHFFRLLMSGAPNIIELLFAKPVINPAHSQLAQLFLPENRRYFITHRAVQNMISFADSTFDKYVKTGEDKQGYHACRLIDQSMRLIDTGRIDYPLSYAKLFTQIRNGELDQNAVQDSYKIVRDITEELLPISTRLMEESSERQEHLFKLYKNILNLSL